MSGWRLRPRGDAGAKLRQARGRDQAFEKTKIVFEFGLPGAAADDLEAGGAGERGEDFVVGEWRVHRGAVGLNPECGTSPARFKRGVELCERGRGGEPSQSQSIDTGLGRHSTVTDFAKLRGLSTSRPSSAAM